MFFISVQLHTTLRSLRARACLPFDERVMSAAGRGVCLELRSCAGAGWTHAHRNTIIFNAPTSLTPCTLSSALTPLKAWKARLCAPRHHVGALRNCPHGCHKGPGSMCAPSPSALQPPLPLRPRKHFCTPPTAFKAPKALVRPSDCLKGPERTFSTPDATNSKNMLFPLKTCSFS